MRILRGILRQRGRNGVPAKACLTEVSKPNLDASRPPALSQAHGHHVESRWACKQQTPVAGPFFLTGRGHTSSAESPKPAAPLPLSRRPRHRSQRPTNPQSVNPLRYWKLRASHPVFAGNFPKAPTIVRNKLRNRRARLIVIPSGN